MKPSPTATDAFAAARAVVLELLDQVRAHTIRLFNETPSGWLLWAPEGTSNHILWHAGHAVWLQDVLGVEIMTGKSELPAGWSELFGMNCRSVKETQTWPSRREVSARLTSQWDRLKQLVGQMPDRDLEACQTGPGDIVAKLIHGLHDEARHHGEMYLLFKLCRAANERAS